MKFSDIKDVSVDDLGRKLKELKQEIFELKMKNVLGQVQNPMRIRAAKRDLARVLTALSNK